MFQQASVLLKVMDPRFRGDERRGGAIRIFNAMVLLLGTILLVNVAHAVQPSEMLADPALEARARTLSADLRCMVCQNQSIDDSDAPLAADIRILLRERIAAGDSDAAVVDFLVARYGEFILLKPRFNWHTALLWITPFGALILGTGVAALAYRRRQVLAPAPLDAAEQEALRRLTSGGP